MQTYTLKTIQVPFTENEWEKFCIAMRQTGLKKQIYVRKLIIKDLIKDGWIPQEEKTTEPAMQED